MKQTETANRINEFSKNFSEREIQAFLCFEKKSFAKLQETLKLFNWLRRIERFVTFLRNKLIAWAMIEIVMPFFPSLQLELNNFSISSWKEKSNFVLIHAYPKFLDQFYYIFISIKLPNSINSPRSFTCQRIFPNTPRKFNKNYNRPRQLMTSLERCVVFPVFFSPDELFFCWPLVSIMMSVVYSANIKWND